MLARVCFYFSGWLDVATKSGMATSVFRVSGQELRHLEKARLGLIVAYMARMLT